MYRSKVENAAVTWREARTKACAAPMGDKVVWADLGTAETALTEAVKAMLDHEAEEARLAARPKLFVVHGQRYCNPHQEEACTLEEAVELAARDRENGWWWPVDVRTPNGDIVLTDKQLDAKLDEMQKAEIEATRAQYEAYRKSVEV